MKNESDKSGKEENEVKNKEVKKKESGADNDKENESDNNEVHSSIDDEDNSTEKIFATKSSIRIMDKPTRLRGERRGQYICRLARELKNRDSSEPNKGESLLSVSDTTAMEDEPDLHDSVL